MRGSIRSGGRRLAAWVVSFCCVLSPAALSAQSRDGVLPLTRLRLYETGVGYFERSGKLNGITRLPLPAAQLDDALKSLVVLGGARERALLGVTFDSRVTAQLGRALARLPTDSGAVLDFEAMARSLTGSEFFYAQRYYVRPPLLYATIHLQHVRARDQAKQVHQLRAPPQAGFDRPDVGRARVGADRRANSEEHRRRVFIQPFRTAGRRGSQRQEALHPLRRRQTIRAAQGHSIAVELGLESREPPTLLYHGTATRFLDTILIEGLKSQTAFSASATLSSARAPLAAASAVSSTRAAVPAALASVAACLAPLIAAAMGGTTEAAMVATAIALSTLDAFSSASVRAALMTARPGMKASAAATAASLARLAGGCTGQLLSVFYRDAYSALLRQLFWRTRAVRAERQAWLPSERQRRTGRLRTGFRLRVRAQAGCPPR